MKIFFVMQYPGYLRYYDSTVRELAERGHEVVVGFDSPHKQPEGLEALEGMPAGVSSIGQVPRRNDFWWPVARGLRSTIDYIRYWHPDYEGATYLRTRMEKALPGFLKSLSRVQSMAPPRLDRVLSVLRACEHAIPSSRKLEGFVGSIGADVLLVTPLVTDGSTQVDLVKAATQLGMRTAACIGSWDHLTTKGLLRIQTDGVILWNDRQRDEAIRYHAADPSRIVVTGAQPWDRWFGREPSLDRHAFNRQVGLPEDAGPFALFAGSTASISTGDEEVQFVLGWIRALRGSQDPRVRDMPILVRPHPFNASHWKEVDVSEFSSVAVWPRDGANPVNEGDRSGYFDSMHYSALVAGVNTSAMIEAGVVGRPVFTILAREFSGTQGGTLHFRYLQPENGGHVSVASSLAEHLRQVGEVLDHPADSQARLQTFVRTFIRPHGLDVPATPKVADAIERLSESPVVSEASGMAVLLYRPVMFGFAFVALARDRHRWRKAVNRWIGRARRVMRLPGGVPQ